MKSQLAFIFASAALLVLAGCFSQPQVSQGSDGTAHWRGAQNGQVVIYEYSDFECPACKLAEPQVTNFISRYQAKGVKLVYVHFPLEEIHPQARLAAIASECAGKEGKFWEYHDLLFKNSPALSRENLLSYAKEAGLSSSFESCLSSQATASIVDAGVSSGMSLGLRGTPSFQVGDITFIGGEGLESKLSQAADRALSSG